jgi:hypothetical protein
MTSTLKTELKASSEHKGFGQSVALKISSVEGCEKSFEMGGHFARDRNGKISMVYGLT